ncbi:hypothetical protein [Caballeronia sp. KNU42]
MISGKGFSVALAVMLCGGCALAQPQEPSNATRTPLQFLNDIHAILVADDLNNIEFSSKKLRIDFIARDPVPVRDKNNFLTGKIDQQYFARTVPPELEMVQEQNISYPLYDIHLRNSKPIASSVHLKINSKRICLKKELTQDVFKSDKAGFGFAFSSSLYSYDFNGENNIRIIFLFSNTDCVQKIYILQNAEKDE